VNVWVSMNGVNWRMLAPGEALDGERWSRVWIGDRPEAEPPRLREWSWGQPANGSLPEITIERARLISVDLTASGDTSLDYEMVLARPILERMEEAIMGSALRETAAPPPSEGGLAAWLQEQYRQHLETLPPHTNTCRASEPITLESIERVIREARQAGLPQIAPAPHLIQRDLPSNVYGLTRFPSHWTTRQEMPAHLRLALTGALYEASPEVVELTEEWRAWRSERNLEPDLRFARLQQAYSAAIEGCVFPF
jgi:hypothetical protein